MPEFKRTFTGGKMEKDLDERIIPNGSYREALNIEVSTSEGSNVGAAENVLGNLQVTEAINGPGGKYAGRNRHIAMIVDPETDMLYRFISTQGLTHGSLFTGNNHGVWMDRIVEYDTRAKIEDPWEEKEKAVMVDVYKVATTVESLEVIPPPPSGTPQKYYCYEGNCTQCNYVGGPACVPTTYADDPTCNNEC